MRGGLVFRNGALVVLLSVPAWLVGCAGGTTYSVSEDAWTEPRPLYRYTAYSPGISQERIWWGDNEDYRETRFIVGRLRAREAVEIAGQAVPSGTKGVALYTKDGYDRTYYLPPLYRKIVPISPTVAYAQPLDSDTYLRIDLASGATTATPYTQVDAVDWSGSWQQRDRFPFFLAQPDTDAPGLMQVTILDRDHAPAATFPRVPLAEKTRDYLGDPLPEIRYMSSKDPDHPGSYMIGGVWPSGETVHRFADTSGQRLSPDLKGVTRFRIHNDIKLAVAIAQDLYHPILDSGVAIAPLPIGVLGYKPLRQGDGRATRWAVKWAGQNGPLWSVHKSPGLPWSTRELQPDAYYTGVVAIPALATGHSAVAVRNHDGSWDVLQIYGRWNIGAPTSAQAVAKAKQLSRDRVRAYNAAHNAAIAERKRRREEARKQAEAQRAAMADAYIEQFKEAKARGDDDAMFRAAQALGGQHFVDYVLESHSFLIADIENAIRLSNERAAIRAKLEARLNQPTDGYKPQSGWSTYYEQAVDRSEQSYRRNLQHYLRGGNPSDPRVYNLYD